MVENPGPLPVRCDHFPSRLHAFVWRNWQLAAPERMGEVVGAPAAAIVDLGRRMGLAGPPPVAEAQQRRSYVTVIRRNWHLLPMEQLQQLLGWSREHLDYILREDDFLYIKLGILKPACEPLRWAEASAETREREAEIARWVGEAFPEGAGLCAEPLFHFVEDLSAPPNGSARPGGPEPHRFAPRFCYSYFAPYGDALLEPDLDPYPDGLLARLAGAGCDGVWLQAVLYRMAPFPWDGAVSAGWETRLRNLRALALRARRHGIGLYLYLNEPRSMPHAFFEAHPELRGADDTREGHFAALCTSVPAVQDYLHESLAAICRAVPELGGFFTITFSENWTNCWSHYHETGLPAGGCARCAARPLPEVIAEVNAVFQNGIRQAGTGAELIVWDWMWPDDAVEAIIAALPDGVSVMSVSEWDMPLRRGGVASLCGEYSISTIGPGERARRTWRLARARGLRTVAKAQAGNSWEISIVPYIPAVALVARHAENLRREGVDGLMLSWTLGGYPSPGMEVFNALGRDPATTPASAMAEVAARWFGDAAAAPVVRAWEAFSEAFAEFPFDRGLLYGGVLHAGPANPLWPEPTGYAATMVGYPYDAVDQWHTVFPPEVFTNLMLRIADGFEHAIAELRTATAPLRLAVHHRRALEREMDLAEVCAIHCRSAANQLAFNRARNRLREDTAHREEDRETMRRALDGERKMAVRLHAIQSRDSRIGFEASNHYMYVPADLAEKVVNCRWLSRVLA